MRILVTILVLLCGVLAARAGQSALENGTAIIDPDGLRELDHGRLGLSGVILPMRSSNPPLTTSRLFSLPSMIPAGKAFAPESDRSRAHHRAELPNETFGI